MLIVRQRFQPGGVLPLKVTERGDRIVPALDPTTAVRWTAHADDRRASGMRDTIARLALGAANGCFTDGWTGPGAADAI